MLETADDVCLRSSSTVCRIPMPAVVRVDALVRRLSWLWTMWICGKKSEAFDEIWKDLFLEFTLTNLNMFSTFSQLPEAMHLGLREESQNPYRSRTGKCHRLQLLSVATLSLHLTLTRTQWHPISDDLMILWEHVFHHAFFPHFCC